MIMAIACQHSVPLVDDTYENDNSTGPDQSNDDDNHNDHIHPDQSKARKILELDVLVPRIVEVEEVLGYFLGDGKDVTDINSNDKEEGPDNIAKSVIDDNYDLDQSNAGNGHSGVPDPA